MCAAVLESRRVRGRLAAPFVVKFAKTLVLVRLDVIVMNRGGVIHFPMQGQEKSIWRVYLVIKLQMIILGKMQLMKMVDVNTNLP